MIKNFPTTMEVCGKLNLADSTTRESLSEQTDLFLALFFKKLKKENWNDIASSLIKKAYWHPNLFLKVPVHQKEDGTFFRIHYWPNTKSTDSGTEDIHSHRWEYHSKIICGLLNISYYREHADEAPSHIRYACSPNENGLYFLKEESSVCLEQYNNTVVRKNGTHSGTASTIHLTQTLKGEPTVTAFVQTSPISSRSCVYRRPSIIQPINLQRHPASKEDLFELFEMILTNI